MKFVADRYEQTCTDIFSMTLTVALPKKHDDWFLAALRSLEFIAKVEDADAKNDEPIEPARDVLAPAKSPVMARSFFSKVCSLSGKIRKRTAGPGSTGGRLNLMELPREIRDEIYQYYLQTETSIGGALGVLKIVGRVPPLFLANRQIYRETVELAYHIRLQTIAESVNGQNGPQTAQQSYQSLGGLRAVREGLTM